MASIKKLKSNKNFVELQPQNNEDNAFLCLPNEMLYQIFQYSINSIEDIKNLSLVCRKFRSIASSPYCWTEISIKDLSKLFFTTINKGDVETAIFLKENARNAKAIATVKISDRLGRTPLMRAVEIDNLEIVKFLIENGAEINAEADIGKGMPLRRTALNYAIERNNAAILKYLKEKGAYYLEWGSTTSFSNSFRSPFSNNTFSYFMKWLT